MKLKINRHSFSVRLSVYILGITLVLFMLSFSIYFKYTSDVITEEAFEKSNYQVENLIEKIDALLSRVELSVDNAVLACQNGSLASPLHYGILTTNMVKSNSDIISARIAFEPKYFPAEGNYYMLHTQEEGKNNYVTQVLGSHANYDYHAMDWYLIPKLKKEAYWSEPYFDAGASESAIATYSAPVYDSEGNLIAILAASISLDWITEMVANERPYPNSYSFMVSRFALYVSHTDRSRILNETFFTATSTMKDTTISNMTKKEYELLSKSKGHRMFTDGGVERYAFFAPIERIGWSVVIVSSKNDILMQISEVNKYFIILVLCSMVLIFILLIATIHKATRPLKILTDSTMPIAHGNFDTEIPEIKGKGEMRELREAFINMQSSLKNYIVELQSTTQIRERIESELSIATQIQMGMLPTIFPPYPLLEEVDLYATLTPAKEVGGDLYDFFTKDGILYFTVGDASGKGVPASLLMAVTSSLFRSVAPFFAEPSDILKSMNNSIAEKNDANMFITLFIGAMNIETGELHYSSAGHNAPVLKRGDKSEFIKVTPNLPLGIMPDMEFTSHSMILGKDDYLFLYSDGLTEAENYEKELYSDERLLDLIAKITDGVSATEFLDITLNSVHEFVKDNEQSDDLTMLVVKFKS